MILPDSMTKIGDSAFKDCTGFTGELNIPDGVTTLYFTFSGCTGFEGKLAIPDSVTALVGTFSGCSGLTGKLVFQMA